MDLAFCNTLRDDGVGYGNCLNQDFKISRIFLKTKYL